MKRRLRHSVTSWLVCLFFLPNILVLGDSTAYVGQAAVQSSLLSYAESSLPSPASQPVSISVQALNCEVWGACDAAPELRFTLNYLEEDGSDYVLHVQMGEKHYEFPSSPAEIDVSSTADKGVEVLYWAESISTGAVYGQETFRLRYVEEDSQYVFQLLGDQWESDIPGGALVWNIFTPLEVFENGWAKKIEDAQELETEVSYTLLAGRLIWDGIVIPKECGDSGLLANGAASTCGMEAAREKVIEWQNKHNGDIQAASLKALIPARLLKGVIAQESQFYAKWGLSEEYGLGMLTEHGVDMLLQWNEPYFFWKCSLVFGADYCEKGYLNITNNQRAVLIGYVMKDIGTDDEYEVMAEALYASCVQADYIVSYYTGESPNQVADYETLWRIALGVYHAGFGCMSDAVLKAWGDDGDQLAWNSITTYLTGDCDSAVDYFDKVVNYSEEEDAN